MTQADYSKLGLDKTGLLKDQDQNNFVQAGYIGVFMRDQIFFLKQSLLLIFLFIPQI